MTVLQGLSLAAFYVGWPGMMAVSAYVLQRAVSFYNDVHRQPVGRLVLLMVVGWVMMMASLAGIATLFLYQDPSLAPIVLPFFLIWAGSMVLIVWVVHRWGSEAVNINLYYLELQSIDRVKTQFINSMAHELNTPLTPIMLRLSLLADGSVGPLNDRQRAAIESVARNLDRLAVVIDQVVLSTQVQAGTLGLAISPVPVDEIATLVSERLQAMAKEKGVSLEVEPQSGLTIPGDRNRLEWVLQAVLSNAIKFTPRNGIVTLRTKATPTAAIVEVRDTGLGFTREQRAILFQPFRQAHDPMRVTEAGSGLGLYLCRAIVQLHGGSISAESDGPGRGSLFRLTLPVSAVRRSQPEPVVVQGT